MSCIVLFIFASCLCDLRAFKTVKEIPRIVTLLITMSILEEVPAGNIGSTVNTVLFPVASLMFEALYLHRVSFVAGVLR